MLISVIRKGRASVSVYIYASERKHQANVYLSHRIAGWDEWIVVLLVPSGSELHWTWTRTFCEVASLQRSDNGRVCSEWRNAFIGRVFCYAWIIWRIRWNITEMNWPPGRTDVDFAEINHLYIYWTSQGDLQFNQHSFIVIFGGLKLVPKYCLLNM